MFWKSHLWGKKYTPGTKHTVFIRCQNFGYIILLNQWHSGAIYIKKITFIEWKISKVSNMPIVQIYSFIRLTNL